MITFKQFLQEDSVQSKIEDAAKKLLGSQNVAKLKSIPEPVLDAAREEQHSFVKSAVGQWVISVFKHKSLRFAAIDAPAGHEQPRFFMVSRDIKEGKEELHSGTKNGKRAYKDYTNFKGVSAEEKRELKKTMDRELRKFKDSDHRDPDSYPKINGKTDWPADRKYREKLKKRGKSIPKSDSTTAYHRMYGEELFVEGLIVEGNVEKTLRKKAEATGIAYGILKQVFNRGAAAWRQHHRPGINQVQWALGRVNSFITGKGQARKADKDLWAKA